MRLPYFSKLYIIKGGKSLTQYYEKSKILKLINKIILNKQIAIIKQNILNMTVMITTMTKRKGLKA